MRKETTLPAWEQMSPQFDDALAQVPEKNRLAIVLKFLQGKTSDEVGQFMGISSEAARKRISRGLDELREIFRRRGIVTSADALGAALSAGAIHSAPPGLAGTTSAAIAKGAFTLAKPASAAIAGAKLKIIVACVAAAAIVGGTTTVALQVASQSHPKPPAPVAVTIAMADSSAAPAAQSQSLTGIIRDTHGNPVSGAKVSLGFEGHQVYVDGQIQNPQTTTGADGKFSLPAHAPPYAIIACNSDGFAQVSWKKLETGADITLQPWGSIQGILKVGDQPLTGEHVHLWRVMNNNDPWQQLVHFESSTTTDVAGHFVFSRVVPGEEWVYREIRQPIFGQQQWRYVIIEAGKTTAVNIGGEGRAIIGRVSVPDDAKALVDWSNKGIHEYMAEIRRQDLPPQFQHSPNETPEQYTAAEENWGKTDAGKLYKQWMFGSQVAANSDGSFKIDDIPPGQYRISFRFLEVDQAVRFAEDVAGAEALIEIPAAASSTNAPVDAGALKFKILNNRVKPGQAAPDFSVTTLDGSPWKLADQIGRPIALIFWSAYEDRQGRELQQFSDFAQRWSQDERVAILGAFIPGQRGEAEQLIHKYSLNFPQTSDGQKLMTLYDTGCPEAILIGADGKVIEKHLNADLLQEYLTKEVAKEK